MRDEPQSYEELWRRYHKLAVKLVQRRTNFEVEDVVMTIFERAVKTDLLSRYDPEGGPFTRFFTSYVMKSWYGIVEAIQKQKVYPLDPYEHFARDEIVDPHRYFERIEAQEYLQEIREFVRSLKPYRVQRTPAPKSWLAVFDQMVLSHVEDSDRDRRSMARNDHLGKRLGQRTHYAQMWQQELVRVIREEFHGEAKP